MDLCVVLIQNQTIPEQLLSRRRHHGRANDPKSPNEWRTRTGNRDDIVSIP